MKSSPSIAGRKSLNCPVQIRTGSWPRPASVTDSVNFRTPQARGLITETEHGLPLQVPSLAGVEQLTDDLADVGLVDRARVGDERAERAEYRAAVRGERARGVLVLPAAKRGRSA
jgi:hypothetical protein